MKEKTFKGLKTALEALKTLGPEEQKKLLSVLIKKDPELVRQLKENLFEFEDIAQLAKADFKFLWFEIPRGIWLLALRAASNELLIFIRSCQTERAFSELLDDLKALGPQSVGKVMQAQKQLLDEIRTLAQQGKIHLPSNKK